MGAEDIQSSPCGDEYLMQYYVGKVPACEKEDVNRLKEGTETNERNRGRVG